MISAIFTRYLICARHGHEWRKAHRKAHRKDGTSYQRCMGCDEVRA